MTPRTASALQALRAGARVTQDCYGEGARVTVAYDAATATFTRRDQDMFGGETSWPISEAEAAAWVERAPPHEVDALLSDVPPPTEGS